MGLLFDVLNPPSESSDAMGLVEFGGLLIDVIVNIAKDLRYSTVVI
jgi:hypothetical protein